MSNNDPKRPGDSQAGNRPQGQSDERTKNQSQGTETRSSVKEEGAEQLAKDKMAKDK